MHVRRVFSWAGDFVCKGRTVIVGVPKEIKRDEYRVAMLPVGVEEMVRAGHKVLVEAGAGLGSGLPDHDYLTAGAELVSDAPAIFRQADLIVKVKEPQPSEWPLLRSGQLLFTYFHFAASRELTMAMIASGATCIAYETLEDKHGRLPLLTPMSEVAGRMSIQEGAKFLERPQMGAAFCWAASPAWPPRTSRSWEVVWSARTRPRSLPGSERMWRSSTSTSTASATWTT